MLLDYPDRERMQLLTPELDELLLLNYPPRFVAEFVYTLDRDGWAEAGDTPGRLPAIPVRVERVALYVHDWSALLP